VVKIDLLCRTEVAFSAALELRLVEGWPSQARRSSPARALATNAGGTAIPSSCRL